MYNKFEIWEDSGAQAYTKVEDAEKRIKEMMPIGLAHVYIFDGERVEKPIGSTEFKKDLKESIVGVLGLNKLLKAQEFLGNQTRQTSLIKKVSAQLIPTTTNERAVLEKEQHALRARDKANTDIINYQNNVEKLTREINIAREAQKSIDDLKSSIKDRDLAESKVTQKQNELENLISNGNSLASRLVYKLELAKTYSKYQQFINNEDEPTEVYDNLYESVIQDIMKRDICICGRPVHDNSPELEFLRSLKVLPHDNAHYLNVLKSLYANLDDMPHQLNILKKYRLNITKAQKELEGLRNELENISERISEKEKNLGSDNQTNISSLEKYRASFQYKIKVAQSQVKEQGTVLSSIKSQLNHIKNNTEHNKKVNKALEMLEFLKLEIDSEFEKKKNIARTSIENNMNKVLREVMTQNYEVKLDNDYNISVWKIKDNSSFRRNETDVLSTGQNVVIYLSFLKALLMTIKEHSEFDDIQSSGVIMDAALSNLDEEHIENISLKILGDFDQLIFLSYKAQLRKELISGIKTHISQVYELSKDIDGNIVYRTLAIDTIEDYINKGENDGK